MLAGAFAPLAKKIVGSVSARAGSVAAANSASAINNRRRWEGDAAPQAWRSARDEAASAR
jgi:hypothetical protein